MTESNACPKCKSVNLIDDAQVAIKTLGEDLTVRVEGKPHAKLFKGGVNVSLKARVCGSCGYTELYATDPQRLLDTTRSKAQ